MALTITRQTGASTNLGLAAKMPLYSYAARPLQFGVYEVGFDASYPTNGEDISSFIGDWGTVLYVGIEQKDTSDATNTRYVKYDYAAEKLVVYDNMGATKNEAEDTTDESALVVRILVVGYAL